LNSVGWRPGIDYGTAGIRKSVLVLLTLALSSCSTGQPPPGGGGPPSATVNGHVKALACVGAGSVGCPSRPAAGIEIDFMSQQGTGMAVTDSAGAYSIELVPGTYTVHLGAGYKLVAGPSSLQVGPGQTIVADFEY
jgi:hypothetical protein